MNDLTPFDSIAAGPWPYGPMTLGQILDRIFRLMRKHFRPFVGIAAISVGCFFVLYSAMILPMALSGAFSNPPVVSYSPQAFLEKMVPAMLLFCAAFMAIYALYCAAASHAALDADLGAGVGFRTAYAQVMPRSGRYIWLMILRTLYVALPIVAVAAIIALGALIAYKAGAFRGNPLEMFLLIPLGILFYVGALAYSIVMSLRLSLAIPVCVEEGLTAAEALRRSGRLTRGAKGRIFLVLLVVYAVTYVAFLVSLAVFCALAAVIGLLAAAMHAPAPLGWTLGGVALVVLAAGMFLFMSATYSSYSAAFAVLYHDQRRRELPLQAGETA